MDSSKELNLLLKSIDQSFADQTFFTDLTSSLSRLLGSAELLKEELDYNVVLEGLSSDFYRTMIGTAAIAFQEAIIKAHESSEGA